MKSLPLISIAVPSFNQARFIRETLQSIVNQNYPNLEVIIQDGGSTDGAVEIAREFVEEHPSIFKLFVENDKGQAQAVNRALRRTHGEILGYLNTDDTLYPDCLHRVAEEIDPSHDRYIVFGRCLFTGEGSAYVGAEHPAEYTSHFDHLAIWKRGYNTIPQPGTFWHRNVYERCGEFDETQPHVLDYDLFCRFSRRHRFIKVDELWSTYRMHAVSKSARATEAEVLMASISVSRRYWGSWWRPLRWHCELSHWWRGQQFHERARHHARRAEESWDRGRLPSAVWEAVQTTRYSPKMAWHRLLQPLLAEKGYVGLSFLMFKNDDASDPEFTGRYSDKWIGPVYRRNIQLPHPQTEIIMVLEHVPQPDGHHAKIDVELLIDGCKMASARREEKGQFNLSARVNRLTDKDTVALELRTRPYFVARLISGAPDDRKLCALLLETTLKPCGDTRAVGQKAN